jgi:hypothetical protein
VSRVGPPGIQRDELVSFQLQLIVFERLGNQNAVRNIPGKKPTPEVVDPRWREMLLHGFDDLRRRDRLGARETLQERRETKEMIAVSVGDIDRGEILSAGDDPIQ